MSRPTDQPTRMTAPADTGVAAPAQPAEPPLENPSTWQLLRGGPFARYAAGETVSMAGTWMQNMAQSWIVAGLTNSTFQASLVTVASSIPMLVLTMFGGTVADRADKRKVLQVTQVVQIVLALAVGFLVLKGWIQIWHLIVAAALLGIATAFEMPAAAALVPELVKKEQIAGAIAIDRSIFHGTRLVGTAAGGYLIAKLGGASAFFVNSATFLALMIALWTIQPRARGTDEEEEQRSSGGIKAGWNYVRNDPPTLAMLGLMALASLCVFPFMAVMLQIYARRDLHFSPEQAGNLMAVSGLGSLVASLGVLQVARTRRVALMSVGAVDVTLSLIGFAYARSFPGACVALTLLAVGTSFIYALANTSVQERAPSPLRGRVSALAAMSFIGVMPFAAMGMGRLADIISIRTTMLVAAVIYGVAAGSILLGPGRRCSEHPPEATALPPEPEAA